MATVPVLAAAALVLCGGASAGWSVSASGTGALARAQAITMTGRAPAVIPLAGHKSVTLTWAASAFAANGYVIHRYSSAAPGNDETVGGDCVGSVSALTCTDKKVPAGTWEYTVTPASVGDWRGTESPRTSVSL